MSSSPITFGVMEKEENITKINMNSQWGKLSFRIVSNSPKEADYLISALGRLTLDESFSFIREISPRGLPGRGSVLPYQEFLDRVSFIGRRSESPEAREFFWRQSKSRSLFLMDEDMDTLYVSSDEENFQKHIHAISSDDEDSSSDGSSSGIDSTGFHSLCRRPLTSSKIKAKEQLKMAKDQLKNLHKNKDVRQYKANHTKIDTSLAKKRLKNNK